MVASSSGSMVRSGGAAASSTGPSASGKGHSPPAPRRRAVRRRPAAPWRSVRCSSATTRAREARQAAEEGTDALGPLGVDEGDLGAGVLEPVAQLLAAPPGVEGHHDGAGQGGGPEGHDPLGDVAHDDGDPVALLRPRTRAEPVGQRAGDAVVLGEGRALVLVDQEGGVAVAERHVEHGPQRGGLRSSRSGWARRGCRAPPSRRSARSRSGWRSPRRC